MRWHFGFGLGHGHIPMGVHRRALELFQMKLHKSQQLDMLGLAAVAECLREPGQVLGFRCHLLECLTFSRRRSSSVMSMIVAISFSVHFSFTLSRRKRSARSSNWRSDVLDDMRHSAGRLRISGDWGTLKPELPTIGNGCFTWHWLKGSLMHGLPLVCRIWCDTWCVNLTDSLMFGYCMVGKYTFETLRDLLSLDIVYERS